MTELASLSIPPANRTETSKSVTPAHTEKDGKPYHYEKRHRHHHHPPGYYARYDPDDDGNGSPYEDFYADFTYDAEDFSGPFSDDSQSDVICAPKANSAGLDLQPTEMEGKNDADEKADPEQDGVAAIVLTGMKITWVDGEVALAGGVAISVSITMRAAMADVIPPTITVPAGMCLTISGINSLEILMDLMAGPVTSVLLLISPPGPVFLVIAVLLALLAPPVLPPSP
ncbi:hypothetical protein CFO_g3574 [Ceratocystis platani]|uniref:Uncharacterized protein n=1 Tax=Ceratocystis fimbriata f. sp. platani TaxID=88771 RepID=A0A0F8AZU4_CERFI|nr:hypothetical protein CFO_g3574 [Ceratocystis platani]